MKYIHIDDEYFRLSYGPVLSCRGLGDEVTGDCEKID